MPRPASIAAAALLLCLSPAACSKTPGLDPTSGRTLCSGCNVVLISMDTVRADHLGTYGYSLATSPHVDELAARSVVFEHAISQSAWTLPAHGSMMTGLYPSRLGVVRYPALRRLPIVPTLAEMFRRRGYATGGFTGGGFVSAHFGFDRGFDVYSSKGRRFEHNMADAMAWLQDHRDKRFFLFFHGYDAHRPYYSTMADRRAIGLPLRAPRDMRGFCARGKRSRPDNLATIVRYYDASIHHGDHAVGRLLNALERLDLLDRTVVLITSDHGEEFFEHGHCDHVRFLYQEVIRVPYILHVPGLTPTERRVPATIPASISVARTLLEIVGVETEMPGVSLVPVLRGDHQASDPVFSETSSAQGNLGSRGGTIAMTTDEDKLIDYLDEDSSEGYDLITDPGEQRVLPKTHPVYDKRPALRAWKASLRPLPRPPLEDRKTRPRDQRKTQSAESEPKLPRKLGETLRSLGYLE